MTINSLYNEFPEVPFTNEISFSYKKEFYKVHVNLLIEKEEIIYKLYFKNNIEQSDKSLMLLTKKPNLDGDTRWVCKINYFSYENNDMAAVAGLAIDSFLQNEKK